MVRDDAENARRLLLVAEGALDPDLGVGEFHARRVEADQPAGCGMGPVVLRAAQAAFELGALVRVEEVLDRSAYGAGEHVGVQGGLHQVVLDGGEGGGDLAVGEVPRAFHGGEVDARRARAEAGDRRGPVQPLG
ncbi:hypothetical protein ID875_01695 [Streptomyces globisporus]|uniref:Uncharacterized protein n=1 Tax=Streptomyces globisporus TaxID=1908 RepID=A0A927GM19_STRGL|nr:hypothetical protein [Streptomyces globisporus]